MAEKPDSQDPFHHIFGNSDSASPSGAAGSKRELSRRERREAAERAEAERETSADTDRSNDAERRRRDEAARAEAAAEIRARSGRENEAVRARVSEKQAAAPNDGGRTQRQSSDERLQREERSRRAQAEDRRARAEADAEAAAAEQASPVSARRAATHGSMPSVTPRDAEASGRPASETSAGRPDRTAGKDASSAASSDQKADRAGDVSADGAANDSSDTTKRHDPSDAEWLRVITGAVDTTPGDEPAAAGSAASTSSRSDRRRSTHLEYDQHEKKSRKGLIAGIVIVVVLALIVGGGVYAWNAIVPGITSIFATNEPDDYEGSGSGEVLVTIISGDNGSDIAKTLKDEGVIASQDAFYQLLLAQADAPVFQPGTYALAKKMSAQAALDALQDPASKQANGFVIPEGTAMKDAFDLISSGTGVSVDDLNAAAADTASFGLPAEAKTLEGFLFPATYEFEPNTPAHDILKRLVDRMYEALDKAGVAPENRWKTVVLAALVQREAGLRDDYPKVARVFLNRSDPALWPSGLLQSDATVAYGTGNTHLVTTTDAERADANNPYNTYVHPGMVIGPISNPGDIAIDAAVHPADGSWLYFVTWNLETGETVFSNTLEEHEAGVRKWQQWMKDNPDYGG
ncbi:endolytic transglycosylase MltG [Leifsonia sp. ALI-44-B]|uniref:endolytic transglycosylase MltG n=1 Tax=Leifsonia sp. ALI-44-B TaxID=1933776 RepID=UPI001EE7672D|nr:endolytic transglycosylase MltG [Leifsonia sp. ALI-44-B]